MCVGSTIHLFLEANYFYLGGSCALWYGGTIFDLLILLFFSPSSGIFIASACVIGFMAW